LAAREPVTFFAYYLLLIGAQEGFAVFRQKSNQKGLQQKGFFALEAFALQTGQNHGLQLFCPASHPHFLPFCKNLLCPFHHTCPPSFCPLSPEADLLRKSILF
jgi:hypothetical protein